MRFEERPMAVRMAKTIAMILAASVAALALAIVPPEARAASVSPTLSVQGVLRKADGSLAPDANYDLSFGLFAAATGGAELTRIDRRGVPVKRGVFAVTLDLMDTSAVVGNGALWVEVQVGINGPKLPRQRLVPTAYALQAEHANSADSAQSALRADTATSATSCTQAERASSLMCTGCVASDQVGFNFAASASKGGPASDLSCQGCVERAAIAPCAEGQGLKFVSNAWTCAALDGGGTGMGGGTVTSVIAGNGLSGGTITTTGTLAVNTAAVGMLAGDQIFTGQKTFAGGTSGVAVRLKGAGGSRAQVLFLDDNDVPSGNIQSSPSFMSLNLGGGQSFQVVNDQPRLYVAPSGRVGIGTTQPEQALHVATAVHIGRPKNEPSGNHLYINDGLIRHYFGVSEGATTNNGRYMLMANGGGWVDAGNDAGALLLREDQGKWSAISGGTHFKIFTGGTSSNVSQELNNLSATMRFIVHNNGNVGIGTGTPGHKLAVMGDIAASGTVMGGVGSPDLAENITAAERAVEAADVVVANPAGGESVVRSRRAYETSVLGVISTRPGMLINAQRADVEAGHPRDPRQLPLALAGRVPVKVTLEGGPIRPGDLLTSSPTPGHAMRAEEPWRGGIIGTALEAFPRADESAGVRRGKVIVFLARQPGPSADPKQLRTLEARVAQLEEQLSNLADRTARLAALERRVAALGQPRSRRLASKRP